MALGLSSQAEAWCDGAAVKGGANLPSSLYPCFEHFPSSDSLGHHTAIAHLEDRIGTPGFVVRPTDFSNAWKQTDTESTRDVAEYVLSGRSLLAGRGTFFVTERRFLEGKRS